MKNSYSVIFKNGDSKIIKADSIDITSGMLKFLEIVTGPQGFVYHETFKAYNTNNIDSIKQVDTSKK